MTKIITINYVPDLNNMCDDDTIEFKGFKTEDGKLLLLDPKSYPPYSYGCKFEVSTDRPNSVSVYECSDYSYYVIQGNKSPDIGRLVPKSDTVIKLEFCTLESKKEQREFLDGY